MHRYNPAGVKVKVFEMPHEPDRFSPRGGPNTGDHVDILGRQSLNDLILRVAAGRGGEIEDTVVSKMLVFSLVFFFWLEVLMLILGGFRLEYADNVKIYEEDRYLPTATGARDWLARKMDG